MLEPLDSTTGRSTSQGPFSRLHADVNELLSRPFDQGLPAHERVRRLQLRFDGFKPAFLDPLGYPPRNPDNRQQLQSGENVTVPGGVPVDAVLKSEALALSDALEVNELLCAKWIALGHELQFRLETSRTGAAEFVFFTERHHFLDVLLTLIKLCGDDRLPPELVLFGRSLIFRLMEQHLCTNLYKLASDIMRRAHDHPEHQHYYHTELKLVADCVFYLHYQIDVQESGQLARLLELLHECSARANATKSPELFRAAYVVTLTLVYYLNPGAELLDPATGDYHTERYAPDFLDTPEFLAMNKTLASSLSQPGGRFFTCVVGLAWALVLNLLKPNHPDKARFKQIGGPSGPFQALTNILRSLTFRQDTENAPIFVSVIDELIMRMIVEMYNDIRETKYQEAFALRQHQQNSVQPRRHGTDPQAGKPTSMFPDLLGLISAIYSYQPSEALKFWEHPTPEFNQFVILSMPPEHTPSPTWFCAFMEMLGALGRHESCAQHAFDFLLGTPNKAVNLNQVMMYMRDIRTKLSAVETPSFQAPVATGPLSDEVEDQMSAVLGYLQQLMKQSESIRVQIVRNKEWDVLRLLFGLFLCGRISSFLKAQILKTVSGFARSPQLAPLLWSWVENSQLLHTTDASGSDEHHSASIVTDFEAESTAHSYPLTIAFLKLLQVLAASSDTGLLSSVGRESRPGGFLPYLAFVRDSVFLRLDVLDFRYPGDRWHIASHCLRIFVGIVEAYDPQAEHSGDAPTDSSHGHQIMSRFLGHSNQMLRMVCWILQQLEAELPQQRYTMDGDKFELAALLSLQLLEVVLRQEDAFLLSLRARPVTELLTPVHQYLETEGPAIVTICKYILYADNAQLPLYSVRVVYLLSRKHANLVKILANSADAQRILVGFSEKLEAPEDAGNDDNDNDTGSWPDRYTPPENLFGDTTADDAEQRQPGDGELSVRRATNKSVKYAMIRLLLDNVAARGYNLAHFFLGFVDSVPFDMTDLSSPESLSCLSVIVDILDGLTPAYCATQPIFVESCYELVYRLCADQRTSTAVLRLLRRPSPGDQSTRYFFQRQLLLCAKAIERTCSPHRQAPLSVYQLNMWAWLLKSVALELHSSNFLDQRATSQTLVELLFLGTDSAERIDELARTIDDPHGDWAGGDLQTRILMLHLLDPVDYKFDDPPRLQGVRFGPFQSVDFDACRSVNAKGVQTIDIRHLYEHLLDQCDSIERGQPSRRKFQQLHQHIHDVLMAAVKQNVCWEAFSAKREYFEAWKQILGIALSRNCFRYLERFDSTWLFDFLETLLRKLERNDLLNPLAETASAAVLMLMYKLTELKQASSQPVARRPSVAQHQPHKRQPHQPHQQHQQSSSSFDAEYLPVDQLQKILRGILSSILRHGATQPLRCNLYGALLNYLKFTQHSPVSSFAVSAAAPAPADGDAPALQPHDVLRQAEQLETNQRMLDIGNRRIINSVGAKFLDALCSDVMDGSERTQTTAFATFDALMNYDSDHKWLDYIVRRGFLRSFIDRLQKTDERIQQLFATPDIRSFKYIAIFEAQLSFFLRVCQHAYGAGVLLRNGLVQKLTDCRFFDQWPGDSAYTAAGDSLAYASLLQSPNSTQQYYHQLLSPVLRLIVCLLSSMPSNKMAASEVCDFLKAHADFVSAVLQDRDPPTKDSLTLLELLSSVFMHLARHDELVQEKLQRKALTFQNLLLHLFAKYSSDRWHASDIHAAMRYLDIDHISAAGSSSASSAAAAASASSSTSSSSAAASSSSLAAASAAAAASKRSQNYDSASKIKEEVFIARDLCKNLVAYCRILTQLPPKATYSTAAGSDDDADADGDTYADGDDRAKTMRPVSMQLSWALFTPVIADESTELHAGPVHGKLPALAVLVQYLKATVAQLSTLKNDLQSLIDKFENCGQLSRNHLIELASYANDSGEPLDEMSALQHYAQIHLASSIAQTEQQIENADYAIENALWVLWRHLHFYLRQVPAAPIETPGLARPSPFFFGPREKQVLVREASAALDSTLSMIYKHQAQAPTKRSLVLQFVPRIRDLLRPSSRSR